MSFKGKRVLITGGSRGIGKAIALRLAAGGARVAIAAKSVEENPKLGGTIFSVAEEIKQAGGEGLPVQCHIRFEEQINNAVEQMVKAFGGIDILINNASAITLTNIEQTEPKRFDLMHDINVRGTFLVSRACIPHLKQGVNPHILTLSPPINLDKKWFAAHTAYTLSKYNMSMIALGLAEELKSAGVASNALWPQTTIATAAVQNLLGGDKLIQMSRKPDIVADAAWYVLQRPANVCTGNFYTDEQVLAEEGITDLARYSVVPGARLYTDLFL